MAITLPHRGENYGLESWSPGQAAHRGMAGSGLEPRESGLRPPYAFTSAVLPP